MQLLAAIQPLQRGVSATEDDQKDVEQLIKKLEKVNPNPKSLASPLINGKWKLIYTTSQSILQSKRPAVLRPNGPIFQYIGMPFFICRYACFWPRCRFMTPVKFGACQLKACVTLCRWSVSLSSKCCLQMLQMARLEIRSPGRSSTRYRFPSRSAYIPRQMCILKHSLAMFQCIHQAYQPTCCVR